MFFTDQFIIVLPAFIAGLLVLTTHIPLGQEVLKRGIIFLDLAIAQMASFGVIIAQGLARHFLDEGSVSEHEEYFWVQGVAITTAVLGALLLYRVRHFEAKIQEALIGILFVLAATGGILFMAYDPHASDRLKAILAGQILWVTSTQLLWLGITYSLLLALWFGLPKRLSGLAFYPIFAITITLSTQLIGVYLVFASLIIPALASLRHRRRYLVAGSIGVISYLVGVVLSIVLDLPTGPTIVWGLAVIASIHFFVMRFSYRKNTSP